MRLLGARLVEIAIGHHAGGKENVRKSVGDDAVHFLGRIPIEGTYTGHQMRYLDAFLVRHYGASHGRSKVVYHHYHVCGMLFQFAGKGHQYTRHALEEIRTLYIEISIGTRHVEVGEKRWLQTCIIGFPCIHQACADVFTGLLGCLNGPHEGGYFHEIGACTRYNRYFHLIFCYFIKANIRFLTEFIRYFA